MYVDTIYIRDLQSNKALLLTEVLAGDSVVVRLRRIGPKEYDTPVPAN